MNIKKLSLALAITAIAGLAGSELLAYGYGYHHGHGRGYRGECRGPGNGRYHHLDFLQKELGLTDAQVKKIIKMDSEYRIKFRKNRDNRDRILSLREEHRKDFEKILTKKQLEQLKKYRSDNRRGRGYHHGWHY